MGSLAAASSVAKGTPQLETLRKVGQDATDVTQTIADLAKRYRDFRLSLDGDAEDIRLADGSFARTVAKSKQVIDGLPPDVVLWVDAFLTQLGYAKK